MKRQQDRDTPPKSKRSRAIYSDHGDRDRDSYRPSPSPEHDRREGRGGNKVGTMMLNRGEFKGRQRNQDFDYEYDQMPKRYRGDRGPSDSYGNASRGDRNFNPEYRTLCIRNINPRIVDNHIREVVYREFKKFGEFQVKVVRIPDQSRIVYINFTFAENAREAKRAKDKLILFDRPVNLDPVYPKRGSNPRLTTDYQSQREPYNNRGISPHSSSGMRPPRIEVSYNDQDYPFDDRSHGNERDLNRDYKFPYHMNHIQPEDDDKATRTLFVGNLDYEITEPELREVFQRYGFVEDIDIKRPTKGLGNAYAFVKYLNLDMAHHAKVEMSGQYIGTYQCKIGYGKVNPTTCLWVGGLGPWIKPEQLEMEFDRFGVISKLEWSPDRSVAYVLYDSIDGAKAACLQMRGSKMGSSGHRLRVDFVDSSCINQTTPEFPTGGPFESWHNNNHPRTNTRENWSSEKTNDQRKPDGPRDCGFDNHRRHDYEMLSDKSDRKRSRNGDDFRTHSTQEVLNQTALLNRENDRAPLLQSPILKHSCRSASDSDKDQSFMESDLDDRTRGQRDSSVLKLGNAELVDNVNDLAKCLPIVWSGALMLKNSAFAAHMHLISGAVHLVDTLMRDPTSTEMPVLRITQRLRLDQSKLDEVGKKVNTSGPFGHSILLAMPGSSQALEDSNSAVQPRPLRNLVSYLKQKEAAGVIPLPPNPGSNQEKTGVLHAFPPCKFGHKFLTKHAPRLGLDPTKEDHLVVIVVE